jgi:hypothetical protein
MAEMNACKFTVELTGPKNFRFCEDRTWRELSDYSLLPSDFYTADPGEVHRLSTYSGTIKVEAAEYPVGKTSPLLSRPLYCTSRVFRPSFPEVPDRRQLINTIARGDDTLDNIVILNVDGGFELRQFSDFDKHRNDPTIVARYESFVAGNDYIGIAASNDVSHVNAVYSGLLQFWATHLKCGVTQEYVDLPASSSIQELSSNLELLMEHWTTSVTKFP